MRITQYGPIKVDRQNPKDVGFFIFGMIILYLALDRLARILLAISINCIGILTATNYNFKELRNVLTPGFFATTPVANGAQNIASLLIASIITIYLASVFTDTRKISFEPVVKAKFYDHMLCIIILCGAAAGGYLFGELMTMWFPALGTLRRAVEIPYGSNAAITLYMVSMILIVPVFEELLVRGFMLFTLKGFGSAVAVIMTSILFTAMHSGFELMMQAFFFSIAVGILVLHFGSLRIAIISHIFINAMAMAVQLIVMYAPGYLPDFEKSFYTAVMTAGAASLALLIILKRLRFKKPEIRIKGRQILKLVLNPAALLFYALIIIEIVVSVL